MNIAEGFQKPGNLFSEEYKKQRAEQNIRNKHQHHNAVVQSKRNTVAVIVN